MRIGRTDKIEILGVDYLTLLGQKLNYEKWVEFIENNKDYFIWYEMTTAGKELIENLNKVPEWAKEGALYRLNKTNAYSTNKIVKHPHDLIVSYDSEKGTIRIDIEGKMIKPVAKIILEMTNFLNGRLIINENQELASIEQLD